MFTRLKQILKITNNDVEIDKKDLPEVEIIEKTDDPFKDEENKARSIRRTQSIIGDLIDCNEFELFPTFTFNPDRVDVTDDETVKKKLQKWLENAQAKQKRLYGDNFAYVIVPERHKSGVLHFHGVFHNYRLETYDTGHKDRSKRTIYKLKDYDHIGFSNTTKITDKAKTANYVKKYITKELNETEFGKKRYWASRNLKKPEKIYDLTLDDVVAAASGAAAADESTTYENEWCEVTTVPTTNNPELYKDPSLLTGDRQLSPDK